MEGRFVEMVARQLARGMEGASFDTSSSADDDLLRALRACVGSWYGSVAVGGGIAQGGGGGCINFSSG